MSNITSSSSLSPTQPVTTTSLPLSFLTYTRELLRKVQQQPYPNPILPYPNPILDVRFSPEGEEEEKNIVTIRDPWNECATQPIIDQTSPVLSSSSSTSGTNNVENYPYNGAEITNSKVTKSNETTANHTYPSPSFVTYPLLSLASSIPSQEATTQLVAQSLPLEPSSFYTQLPITENPFLSSSDHNPKQNFSSSSTSIHQKFSMVPFIDKNMENNGINKRLRKKDDESSTPMASETEDTKDLIIRTENSPLPIPYSYTSAVTELQKYMYTAK